jgi:hypothetical protein
VIDEAGQQRYSSKTAFKTTLNKRNGEFLYVGGIYAGRTINQAFEIEQAMHSTTTSSVNTTPRLSTSTGVLEPLPLEPTEESEESSFGTPSNIVSVENNTSGAGSGFITEHDLGIHEYLGDTVAMQEQLVELGDAETTHLYGQESQGQPSTDSRQYQHRQLQAQLDASMFTATEVMSGSGGGTDSELHKETTGSSSSSSTSSTNSTSSTSSFCETDIPSKPMGSSEAGAGAVNGSRSDKGLCAALGDMEIGVRVDRGSEGTGTAKAKKDKVKKGKAKKSKANKVTEVPGTAEKRKAKICASCTKVQPAMAQCARCTKLVYYCCRSCQLQHWPLHKSSCRNTSNDGPGGVAVVGEQQEEHKKEAFDGRTLEDEECSICLELITDE